MTEKKLPPLALGAWSWGTGMAGGDQVFGNHYFEDDLRPVFDKAMEKGLTLWDTAAVYGEGTAERILGNFVKDVPREDVLISTKFTPQIAGPGDDAMEKMLEGSLSRLHTDYVDIYWIHNPMDVERWTKDLIPLAKSGKIGKIGVSNHNLAEIKRAQEILAEGGLSISAIQNHYSLLHRSSEKAGILDYCKEHGITFFSYMVLEQGALSGRYDEAHPFPEGTGRGNSYNSYWKEIGILVSVFPNGYFSNIFRTVSFDTAPRQRKVPFGKLSEGRRFLAFCMLAMACADSGSAASVAKRNM